MPRNTRRIHEKLPSCDEDGTTAAPEHQRSIGLIGATSIGIGGMVGGGIFAVLGTAIAIAGGGTPLAFLIAGIVAILTAYSYAKLAVLFPSSGGTVVYIDRAFSHSLTTGSVNLILWLSYLVTIALYASAFGHYAAVLFSFNSTFLVHLLISSAIVVPAIINLLNASLVSKSESIVVVLKLLLLVIVIAAGLPHIQTTRLAPQEWPSLLSLVLGGMVIFVAYEGFELIGNAAEDVKAPKRTLPHAFFLSVILVIVLYVVIACVTVGSLDLTTIVQAKEYALAEAARPALGHFGFVLVSVSALMATFTAINATIYGNARLGFVLAKERELPKQLAAKAWSRPVSGVAATAGVSLLLANTLNIESIATIGSAGFLLIFTVVNAACFRVYSEAGANRVIAAFAFIASLTALILLLWQTMRHSMSSFIILSALTVVAIILEWGIQRIGRRDAIQTIRGENPQADTDKL